MSNLSRRSLVTTAAALPALAVPALASDGDHELLALGAEFDRVADDWVRQRRLDHAESVEFNTRLEAAGVPPDGDWRIYPDHRFKPGSPEHAAAWATRERYEQIWKQISDEVSDPDDVGPHGESLVWEDIHSRMWPLIERILTFRPKTLAGLALVARAASMCSESLDELEDTQCGYPMIEAVCAFCGVTPMHELIEA